VQAAANLSGAKRKWTRHHATISTLSAAIVRRFNGVADVAKVRGEIRDEASPTPLMEWDRH
jgi:hypothetical protein